MLTCNKLVNQVVAGCRGAASQRTQECSRQADDLSRECTEWKDEGSRECSRWADEGSRACSDWQEQNCSIFSPWNCVAGWFCQAWYWVAKMVCKAYHWVANLVCQAWTMVYHAACVVGGIVLAGVCAATGLVLSAGCGLIGLLRLRIVSSDDEPRADSVPRLHAESMSVARVASELDYRDSGTRFLFRIVNGRVKFRTPQTEWAPLAPPNKEPEAISYHEVRLPKPTKAPPFDMVAANSGRVFVKEAGFARFYMTMLDPMFRYAGNVAIPSLYFKLDPEQGLATSDDRDRLAHIPVDASPHPAAVRFPLFRSAMQIDLNDTMVVQIDRNLSVWHRLDGRPPSDAGAPPEGGDNFPTPHTVVTYGGWLPSFFNKQMKGYQPKKVLDIGVGHEHWHEQRCSIYGGELDSLDGPGLPPCLVGRNAYRLFNGPVEDQGGFIDGTVNYYVLAQFTEEDLDDRDTIPGNAFGILWIDEQAVLSERWRLLDPDDCRFAGFKDIVPSAIVQYLEKDFRVFRFDRSKYWCPMRAGHVTPKSRMAVSRCVIVVSGRDPGTGHWELCSINSSFGTSDRTWQRRALPETDRGSDSPPEEFGLREDMTLYVKDTRKDGVRYWFQRYLSASAKTSPDNDDRKLPDDYDDPKPPAREFERSKPPLPPRRHWHWFPEDVFNYVHQHTSHFGCFESVVDWRWQYYRLTVLEGEEVLNALPESTRWAESTGELFIRQDSIDWGLVNSILKGESHPEVSEDLMKRFVALATGIPSGIGGALSNAAAQMLFGVVSDATRAEPVQRVLCEIYKELRKGPLIRQVHRTGLFQNNFVLSLRRREPYGWIMVHWDKRDDDLLPFCGMTDDAGRPFEITLAPDDGESTFSDARVRVRVESYHSMWDVPQVEIASVTLVLRHSKPSILRVVMATVKSGDALDENIWRVKLGCLTRDAAQAISGFEVLFDAVRLSADRASANANGSRTYEWDLDARGERAVDVMANRCSEAGRQRFGMSIWFEDVVGHLATPDFAEFRTIKE